MDLEKNLKDVFKRQFVDSDQILWDLKKESVWENAKEEDEEVDEDLELLNS